MGNVNIKEELAVQAAATEDDGSVKLTRSMSIPDMVKAMMPEIRKALPSVLTPERFTRIALSALNNTPALQQ
ncbi:MAG: recombinase RecT, partial [Lachnospiraceae bacterium]|nr:recombinase RecT [Lachnospiraceae bacterium]